MSHSEFLAILPFVVKHCGATILPFFVRSRGTVGLFSLQIKIKLRCSGTDLDNERPKDWQNVSAITRFRQIEVLFQINYYKRGKENRRYVEFRYIEVPL